MALINCKNCGNQISDKAQTCPHCKEKKSNRTTLNFTRERYIIALIIAVVSISSVATFKLISSHLKSAQNSELDKQPDEHRDGMTSTSSAEEIIKQYYLLQNSRSYAELQHLYTQNIERFYLQKNITSEDAINLTREYDQKNPENKFILSNVEVNDDISATAYGEVCENLYNCKATRVIFKISNGKIKYVRSYLMKQSRRNSIDSTVPNIIDTAAVDTASAYN